MSGPSHPPTQAACVVRHWGTLCELRTGCGRESVRNVPAEDSGGDGLCVWPPGRVSSDARANGLAELSLADADADAMLRPIRRHRWHDRVQSLQ